MKLGFEEKAGYLILGAIFVAPIIAALVFLGLLVWIALPSPVDRLVVEATAPDGGAIIRVARHDNGMGFGLGDEWGIVAVDQAGRWFGRTLETVAEFDCDRLDEGAVRAEWRDARHAVVTLPKGTRVWSRTAPSGGLEVEVRSVE